MPYSINILPDDCFTAGNTGALGKEFWAKRLDSQYFVLRGFYLWYTKQSYNRSSSSIISWIAEAPHLKAHIENWEYTYNCCTKLLFVIFLQVLDIFLKLSDLLHDTVTSFSINFLFSRQSFSFSLEFCAFSMSKQFIKFLLNRFCFLYSF